MSVEVVPIKTSWLFFNNYGYLVFDTIRKNAVMIDAAWQISRIEHEIKCRDLKLSAILLTHSHFDHVQGVNALAERHNVPVYISQVEHEYYKFYSSNLHLLEHDEAVVFGDIHVTPWLTPGHTKGSMCFFVEKNLFTGDTLFIEGCGLCFGKGGDPKEMYATVQRLRKNIAQDVCVYPGHSYGIEPGKEFSYLLKNNIYFEFKNERDFIAFRMRKGQKGLFNFK